VLLMSDGPRVIDIAISGTGQSIGLPGYLSPEQAVGGEVGPPADIFSLGAVLAFAASGNGPFGTGSLPALVYRAVHQPPALEGVPGELRPLIERCLAKAPEARPTASDLLAELADVQPGPQWLPEWITAALASFAMPAPPSPTMNMSSGPPGTHARSSRHCAGCRSCA
jgi:eukaryotic-like serine/threonine-protein kinase